MKFNHKTFFDNFRDWRGAITQQQVQGLTFLLDCIEADPFITRIDWASYLLATTIHETAFTFMPIHEYGGKQYFINRYGSQTRIGKQLGNDTPEEGYDYAGKGDVQLTGESNYEKAEIALRREYPALVADFERRTGKTFDLTVGDQQGDKNDPKNAQDPQIAYAIMSYGMRSGMFTGFRLNQFLNNTRKDYKGARRIINGTDKDDEIAVMAQRFEQILKASLVKEQVLPITQNEASDLENGLNDTLPVNTYETQSEQPQTAVSGISETKVEVNKDGEVKVESKDSPPAPIDKEKIAIEKPEPQGFIDAIRNRIGILTGGNIGFDFIQEKLSQIQALGLSPAFWLKVSYFVIGGSVLYLIFFAYKHYSDNKKQLELTNKLIEANSTPDNFVQLIAKEEIEDFKTRGYKVITR